MARLKTLRVVDPVLTQIAHGYTNEEFIGSALFPFVPVQKEGGEIPKFGKEHFRVLTTERAIRAKTNKILPEDIGSIAYVLTEHDAAYPIDYREQEDAMEIFNLQEHGALTAQQAVMLRHEKACADLAQANANFPAGNKVALSGTSQFTDTTNSDPIGVIETAREAVRSKIVKYPNTMVMGASTLKALRFHPKITELVKYTGLGKVTLDLLRDIFEVPNIFVGKAVYLNSANAVVDIWGDNIILAYVAPENMRGIYEPSFGYTLRKSGFPEADEYEEEGGKITNMRSTDRFEVKIVGSDAGYLIENTNA